MKKALLLLAFIACFNSFSQGISVNTTTYTPDQLINQVLINSPCVSGFGVTTKNGSDFGSTPSIGYFENMNPNFPITRGVVLSTGNVTRTPSPNNVILSDGSIAWTGDADMEAALLAQGLTIRTINASYIEFDFHPKTPLFNFSFVFASEEYGTSQCNFSDSFAFLLKDNAGGNYTNLAVIPSTNTPIAVTTIRDNQYNSNCPSANATYFGAFNGSGFGPAINFNGQTVKMTAYASGLDVTHTYHIKIVIADGVNDVNNLTNSVGYDSAIFLEANTFSIGQETLGPDYTIAATNQAFCPGSTTSLPTLNANPGGSLAIGTTYSWFNGSTLIASQTSSTLNLNTVSPPLVPGINSFSVTYDEPNCAPVTDQINVEIYPLINVTNSIPTIYASCSSAPYSFDLQSNTPKIIAATNLPAGTVITYHASNPDAVANINPLTSPFPSSTATLTAPQTIYVRVNSPISPCYVIKTFILKPVDSPVIAAIPTTLSACARNTTDNPPMANFTLTTSKNLIVGTQSLVWNVISYHTSQADADANLNPLTVTGTNVLLSSSRTLFVRLTNISNPNCYVTTSLQLVVNSKPLVDNITDKIVCTSFTLPTLNVPGAFYSTATLGGGTHPAVGTQIIPVAPTNFTNLYVSNVTPEGCRNEKLFKVTLVDIVGNCPPTQTYCNSYLLPAVPYGKFYTQSGGIATPGNLTVSGNLTNTTAATTTTTYYYVYEDAIANPGCFLEQAFTITLKAFTPLPNNSGYFGCNNFTLVADANGGTYYTGPNQGLPIIASGTIFNSTQTIYLYKESGGIPNCSSEKPFNITIGPLNLVHPGNTNNCSSYVLPAVTSTGAQYWTGPIGTGTQHFEGEIISAPSTTLYYYIPGQTCTNNLPFTITNKLQPMQDIPNPSPVCDVFYLPTPTRTSGSYWTGTGGTGTVRPIGFPILSNPPTYQSTIYFVDKDPNDSSCFVQDSFDVTVYPSPLVDVKPREVVTCNTTYILDNLTNGEYYQFPGGPSASNPVLPAGYPFAQSTGATTIYVYNFAPAPNTCTSEYSIAIDMYNTSVTPIDDIYACNNYTLPAPQTGAHYYALPGGPLVPNQILMDGATITTTTSLYIYMENNVRIPCSDQDGFTVHILTTPIINPIVAPAPVCDTFALPLYNTITSTVPVTHYYTLPGGANVVGQNVKNQGDSITASSTIYAYAEVVAPPPFTTVCYDQKPIVITVNQTPVISTIPAVYSCDVYSLPAYNTIATTVGSVSKYYTLAGGPATAGNVERVLPYNVTTPGLTTLYAYAETGTTPNCFSNKPLAITILTTPIVSTIPAVTACDTYSLPSYSAIPTAFGSVSHYYTLPGGPTVLGQVAKAPGDAITSSTTLFAYAEVGAPATRVCYNENQMAITINVSPVLAPVVSSSHCATENFTLSSLTVGGYYENALHTAPLVSTTIAATKTIYVYAETGTTPNCSDSDSFVVTIYDTPTFATSEIATVNVCNEYRLPVLTTPNAKYYTGPNATGTEILPGTIYTAATQIIYVHAESGVNPVICPADAPLVINVFNVTEPLTNPNSNVYCGQYTLIPLASGESYHTLPGGLGTTYVPGNSITSSQDIHVFATAPSPFSCSDDYSFNVQVTLSPTAFPIPLNERTVCDTDTSNDGFTSFDLTALTPTLLGTQTGPQFSVQYFASYANATAVVGGIVDAGINPITSIVADHSLTTVFYSISDNSAIGSCKNINSTGIQLIVNELPRPSETIEPHAICIENPASVPPVVLRNYTIQSNLSPMNYSFVWTDSLGAIVGNGSTYTASIADTYNLIATSNSTGCSSIPFSTVVINSQKPIVTYTVSDAFEDNQIITVIADGIGDYEYQIDGSPFQDSPVFENQNFILDHQIIVRDKNGCNDTVIIPVSAVVVNFPKLFTPNGDGWYDTWKVYGINQLSNAKVSIFNRYGKLVAQLNQNNPGWDGTFNNTPMPADDYWFTISYIENGLNKEYKSHFSITR